MSERRERFRAMGTDVEVLGPAVPRFAEAADRVRGIFAREERRFSRFLPTSELSRVNARAGRRTPVSPSFAAVAAESLRAARETDGLFDPTVLPALIAAGYDRDIEEVRRAPAAPRPSRAAGRGSDVEVGRGWVRLPAGAGLDLGGIAKGWTVDAAALAAWRILPWVVVNAGGDLRLEGERPDPLEVGVEDPTDGDAFVVRLRLEAGALATSSIARRSWGPGLHHLIDPRTGLPASTGVLQATACASTCTRAEVLAKTLLLSGPSALGSIPGVLVTEHDVLTSVEPSAVAA